MPLVRRGAALCSAAIHSQTEAGETGIEAWCSRKTFSKCFLVIVAEVSRRMRLREATSAKMSMDMVRASMPKISGGVPRGKGGTDLPSMILVPSQNCWPRVRPKIEKNLKFSNYASDLAAVLADGWG